MSGDDQRGDAGEQAIVGAELRDHPPGAVGAGPGPDAEDLRKAIRLEADEAIAPDRRHQHDLIQRHGSAQVDFHPLKPFGGLVRPGAGADGADAAPQVVVREVRQLSIDLEQALLQRRQRRWRGGKRERGGRQQESRKSSNRTGHRPPVRAGRPRV